MHFGSDENYFRWKKSYKEGPCEKPFTEIYQVAYKDLYAKVVRRLGNREDAEDVLSEIGMKLYKHLPAFLEKSDDCAAGQRNAWLNQIARNATNDYLRTKLREKETLLYVDADALETLCPMEESPAWRMERDLARTEALKAALEPLLLLTCKPEKLLLFVLYVFLQEEEYVGSKKQYLEWLAARLGGLELFDLYAQVRRLLRPLALSERCFAPLKAALHQPHENALYGNRRFAEETRTLVVWISNLHARMQHIGARQELAHVA